MTEEELKYRKSRIIHSAFQLFCQHGIDGVTMEKIAKVSGVGAKSVYRYFNTKRELLVETVSMLWQEIVGTLADTLVPDYEKKSGYDQIVILMEGFRRLFESNQEYVLFSYDYKLFFVRHSTKMTEDEYDEILRPLHELYIRALKKGERDGSIRLIAEAEDVYFAIWGLMRGFVVKIVIYDRMLAGKNPWKDRFDIARRLILSGLKNGAEKKAEA